MRLVFESGPRAGTEIATAATLLHIGSAAGDNHLVIDDPDIAPEHAIVQRWPSGLHVLQKRSPGCKVLVNGQDTGARVHISLSVGDRVRIGSTEVRIGDGQPVLRALGGPQAGRVVHVGADDVTIGRAADCTLAVDDSEASAHHATVRSQPLGFVLVDQASTNGTTVNGHRIDQHVLADGDAITIGKSHLRFLLEGTTGEQEQAPARLVFLSGPEAGRVVLLSDVRVVLGRRNRCDVSLWDREVSGEHCAITRAGDRYLVTDLGSSNGTVVNGRRIAESKVVRHGDLIELGHNVIKLEVSLHAQDLDIDEAPPESAHERPSFVVGEHVDTGTRIVIGSSPTCDLWLDGLAPQHCAITWKPDTDRDRPGDAGARAPGGFFIEDLSTTGTYLNDRRVSQDELLGSQVLTVGHHLIQVEVRGTTCVVQLIDQARAMATLEVARETALELESAVPDPANRSQGMAAVAYKTVAKLDVRNIDMLIEQRRAKYRPSAPAWRPSTDITPNHIARAVFATVLVASLLVCMAMYLHHSDRAWLNHPLSESHGSERFAAQAAELGLDPGCAGCHSAGQGVPDDKCIACHAGFDRSVRPAHLAAPADIRPDRAVPGGRCAACHTEHMAEPRFDANHRPTLLGAGRQCSADECHPNQHSRAFLRQGPLPPQIIEAGPIASFEWSQRELHVAHAEVQRGGDRAGEVIAIGCTACHASTGDSGALVQAVPGTSCFGCHEGGQQYVNAQCQACHRQEHQGDLHLVRMPAGDPMMAPVAPAPSPGRSLLAASLWVLAAFVPLVGFGLFTRLYRRERGEQMISELRQHPAETVKRLVHSINLDKCVGCHMCVQACPTSVLELVNHKSVVVNFDACIQCRRCEEVCAFDALRMHEADRPPPMISMPDVDARYMTPLEGMYLIGQASGIPQVKNAANMGTAVVLHMLAEGGLVPGAGRARGVDTDVIIVGSGPAGLAAALTCAQNRLDYVLLEKQQRYGWTVRTYYHKGKPVMAEPHDVDLASPLPHQDTTREQLLAAWDEVIANYGIEIRCGQNVTDVKKTDDVFTVTAASSRGVTVGRTTGLRVVLAIGTMGNPRRLGCPGDTLEKVRNALVDPDEHRDQDLLVVGGSDSVIEVALALCEHNRVWLSCRDGKFDRVKPRNLERIQEAFARGACIPRFATVVREVGERHVVLEHKADGRREQIANDYVLAMIGGTLPVEWLKSIGVPYLERAHGWSPPRTDDVVRRFVRQEAGK